MMHVMWCCMCPCRGVALEGMQRWDEAIADYKTVLAAAPNDPSGRCACSCASGQLQHLIGNLIGNPMEF